MQGNNRDDYGAVFGSAGFDIEHERRAVLPEVAIDPGAGVVARPIAGLADRRIVIAVRTGTARSRALTVVVDALRRATEV